jgi:hypothetical protein
MGIPLSCRTRATGAAASAVGALQCWSKAADRFGVELLASLVRELNVHGVEKDGSASTDCTKVAILLGGPTDPCDAALPPHRLA